MVSVVLGMLVCVFLALVVMALVAVPARREGREVLSERGEDIVGSIRERQLTLARGERRERERRGRRPPRRRPRRPRRRARLTEPGVPGPPGRVWFDGPDPEPEEPRP